MQPILLSRTNHRFRFTGSTVSPSSVANLSAWYKPDVGVTAVSGAVSAWNDQSGNGNHLAQNSVSIRPTYTSTINGITVPGFSTNKFINNPTNVGMAVNAFTFFAVINLASISGNSTILGIGATSGGKQFRIVAPGSKVDLVRANLADLGPGASVLALNTTYVVAVRYTGTTLQYYVNGSPDNSPISTTQAFDTAASNTVIGAHTSQASEFFNGLIAEVVTYGRALTDTEVLNVNRYLGGRYAVAVA